MSRVRSSLRAWVYVLGILAASWLIGSPAPAQPPAVAGPKPKPVEAAPAPRPVEQPFGPGRTRLPLLGPQPVGTTPRPTPQVLAEYKKYITRIVDPETTLDLVAGRSRLLILNEPPLRIQIVDTQIAEFVPDPPVTPTEYHILGKQVGSTILNFWFDDRKDRTKRRLLSYLVRVIPDP